MKQVIFKQLLVMLMGIALITSCKKENALSEQTVTDTNQLAKEKNALDANTCSTCAFSTKTYDLLDQLKTKSLSEGNNVIASLDNGAKIIAQVRKGLITQWFMQSKAGTIYAPSSTTDTKQMMRRIGVNYPIYRICFYTDGLYNCWLLIKL